MIKDYLAGLTPEKVRVLARTDKGTRLMTNSEIAEASGLAKSTIALLSKAQFWDCFTIAVADAYLKACGVDPSRTQRHRRMLRRGALLYVKNAPPIQRKMVARVFGAVAANAGPPPVPNAGVTDLGPNGIQPPP